VACGAHQSDAHSTWCPQPWAAVLAVPTSLTVEALTQWGMVANAALHAGQPGDALQATERALQMSEQTGALMWVPEIHRLRAEALRQLGRADEAVGALQRAADLAREMEAGLVVRRLGRGWELPRGS
jgi:tetratricopeptide (TPR) repeat protein